MIIVRRVLHPYFCQLPVLRNVFTNQTIQERPNHKILQEKPNHKIVQERLNHRNPTPSSITSFCITHVLTQETHKHKFII